jgi:hypothetical protein
VDAVYHRAVVIPSDAVGCVATVVEIGKTQFCRWIRGADTDVRSLDRELVGGGQANASVVVGRGRILGKVNVRCSDATQLYAGIVAAGDGYARPRGAASLAAFWQSDLECFRSGRADAYVAAIWINREWRVRLRLYPRVTGLLVNFGLRCRVNYNLSAPTAIVYFVENACRTELLRRTLSLPLPVI